MLWWMDGIISPGNADSKCIGKDYSKNDKGSSGSKRGTGLAEEEEGGGGRGPREILITAVSFHFQLWGYLPMNLNNW